MHQGAPFRGPGEPADPSAAAAAGSSLRQPFPGPSTATTAAIGGGGGGGSGGSTRVSPLTGVFPQPVASLSSPPIAHSAALLQSRHPHRPQSFQDDLSFDQQQRQQQNQQQSHQRLDFRFQPRSSLLSASASVRPPSPVSEVFRHSFHKEHQPESLFGFSVPVSPTRPRVVDTQRKTSLHAADVPLASDEGAPRGFPSAAGAAGLVDLGLVTSLPPLSALGQPNPRTQQSVAFAFPAPPASSLISDAASGTIDRPDVRPQQQQLVRQSALLPNTAAALWQDGLTAASGGGGGDCGRGTTPLSTSDAVLASTAKAVSVATAAAAAAASAAASAGRPPPAFREASVLGGASMAASSAAAGPFGVARPRDFSPARATAPMQSAAIAPAHQVGFPLPVPAGAPPPPDAATLATLPRAPLSRHVTSVITHFTASREGYRRLISELDDFLHVLSPAGVFLYVCPAAHRHLGLHPDESESSLLGRHVSDYLHPEDRELVLSAVRRCVEETVERREFSLFCRFRRGTEFVVMDLKGKGFPEKFEDGPVQYIVQSAREYRSKGSLSIDSILELRLENLRLRRRLEETLLSRGVVDPAATHPLLRLDITEATPSAHPRDLDVDGNLDSTLTEDDFLDQISASVAKGGFSATGGGGGPPFGGDDPEDLWAIGSIGGGGGVQKPQPQDQQRQQQQQRTMGGAAGGTSGVNASGVPQRGAPPSLSTMPSTSLSSSSSSSSSHVLGEKRPLSSSDSGSGSAEGGSGGGGGARGKDAAAGAGGESGAAGAGGDKEPGDGAAAKRRKKGKVPAEELFCRQCGTMSSPEWRKGPLGPKTLCNACGLAFSKKLQREKKRLQKLGGGGGGGGDVVSPRSATATLPNPAGATGGGGGGGGAGLHFFGDSAQQRQQQQHQQHQQQLQQGYFSDGD
ncbi:hypothetical protein DFJ73DRAFT_377737 [Zopfochytrium polystomum]|nr:hypothetical protein DFJ73DRAFT_377737 [Zopfochytrium polystomum]